MKILVVNALQITYKDDGMGKYAMTIIEFLEKNYSNKLKIYYITTNEGRERIKSLVSSDKFIKFHYNKSDSFIKKFYMENIKIVSILTNLKADYYWSLDGKLPLFDFIKNIKILTIHDVGYIDVPQFYSAIQRSYWKLIYKKKSHRSKYIIAISEFTKDRIINTLGINKENIKVIYNFVRESFDIKNLNFNNNAIGNYFLYYGQISPRKNIIGLIQAYHKYYLNNSDPDKLIIIGKKYDYKSLENVVNSDAIKNLIGKYIVFKGYVDDTELAEYIANAKFIINPSFYEGFGLPVIEGFELNKLILASDNTSMIEFINQYEKYTFDPYNIDSISNKISFFTKLSDEELKYEYQIESSIYKNKINREKTILAYKNMLDDVFFRN